MKNYIETDEKTGEVYSNIYVGSVEEILGLYEVLCRVAGRPSDQILFPDEEFIGVRIDSYDPQWISIVEQNTLCRMLATGALM